MKKELGKILMLAEQLPSKKQKELIDQIMQMMDITSNANSCNSLVEEFGSGRPNCPYCHAKANLGLVLKKGKNKNGAQRFLCKQCGHFFVSATNTAFARSRKDADVWRKFIELTINGKSLECCANECNIAYQTAFTWRHKVLNAFRTEQQSTMMEGHIEIDEMLLPISFKGNHVSGKFGGRRKLQEADNNLPRQSYKRGSDNKSASSKDKACIFCMVQDGNKGYYGAVPGVGFMNNKMLDATIGKHVNRENAVVLADQYKTTEKYLIQGQYNHTILSANTSENPHEHKPEIKDGLHMQHVNAMHRHIRLFLSQYCGVSSKYLENYISLFVWLKTAKSKKQSRKIKLVSVGRAAESDCYITHRTLVSRPAIPCCA